MREGISAVEKKDRQKYMSLLLRDDHSCHAQRTKVLYNSAPTIILAIPKGQKCDSALSIIFATQKYQFLLLKLYLKCSVLSML